MVTVKTKGVFTMTPTTLRNNLRAKYLKAIREYLESVGDEVLVTNSNEIAVPCVDEEGNDEFIVLTIKVPTGSRDGEAYDGYGEAQSYAMKCAEKAEKAEKAAIAKAAKIERDKKMREQKAKAKAEWKAGE